MESRWTGAVTTPDLSTWSALLIRQSPFEPGSPLAQLRAAARLRLIDTAQQYMLRLGVVAQTAGVSIPRTTVLARDPEIQPIIVTGHQPVIFHPGLVFKYECTEQVASGAAIGVAVTIDTDKGDPGAFLFPQADNRETVSGPKQLTVATASFCEAAGVYRFSTLLQSGQLAERVRSIRADLRKTTPASVQQQFGQVSEDYCRLSKAQVPAVEANAIIRWSRGIGSRLLELPLSAVCCFPEIVQLTAGILDDFESFAGTYNHQLKEYRATRRIRNRVNPFPDLQMGPDGIELPFWVMLTEDRSRYPLFVGNVNGVVRLFADGQNLADIRPGEGVETLNRLLVQGIQLIPRGALVTSFMRLMFADLFVHGTGGGHYDQLTTSFIESWWKVQPPPFVVASASQYLFPERRSKMHELQSLNENLRELRFNPQRYFGRGVFTEQVESRLQSLFGEKQAVVARLTSARKSGQSAGDIGHQIQRLSDKMKATVDHAFSKQLAELDRISPETKEAVDCRTYPWFLFPNSSAARITDSPSRTQT